MGSPGSFQERSSEGEKYMYIYVYELGELGKLDEPGGFGNPGEPMASSTNLINLANQ